MLVKNFVELFWKEKGVDYVVEFMGLFIIFDGVLNYVVVGVKRVIILVFIKDFDKIKILLMGVNYNLFDLV